MHEEITLTASTRSLVIAPDTLRAGFIEINSRKPFLEISGGRGFEWLSKTLFPKCPPPALYLKDWDTPYEINMPSYAGVAEPGQIAYKGQIIGAGV